MGVAGTISDGACLLATGAYFLGIDTCGTVGSVALGRVDAAGEIVALGQRVMAAGEFSSRLLQAIEELLRERELTPAELAGLVLVSGPGSFTGIRVGLAAGKALAQALELPIVALSRLEMLAWIAGVECAVLNAHRGQFFHGVYGGERGEVLVTAGEINAVGGLTGRVAVCEEAVAQTLGELHGAPEIVRVAEPAAADALAFSVASWRSGSYADVAALDGHYLRGADARPLAKVQ